MELTRAILNDLLRSLRSSPKQATEKRTQPRVGMRLRARAVVAGATAIDQPPIEVWLRDISAGGLGILCNQPFARGDTVRVILAENSDTNTGGSGDDPDLLPCTVAYCRRVGTGLYQIGLKFAAQMGNAQAA